MVTKTFECKKCKNIFEIEMNMNCKEADCPDCNVPMERIFNASSVSILRPGADNNGFYGVDRN